MTRLRRESSRSRARSAEIRAIWVRAKRRSSRSRSVWGSTSSRAAAQEEATSIGTAVLAGPKSGTRAPRRPRHQRADRGALGRPRVLTRTAPSWVFWPASRRSRLAAQRQISASSCPSGFDRPSFLEAGPAPPLAGQQQGGEASVDLVVVSLVQAGGDPTPEDPPLDPALEVLGVGEPLVEGRPEALDPDRVHREADPGAEAVAGQVQPALLVTGGPRSIARRLAERLPEGPQCRGRPVVSGRIEEVLQMLDQPGRAPIGLGIGIGEGVADGLGGGVDEGVFEDVLIGHPTGRFRRRPAAPGGVAELDLELPSAVVAPGLAPEFQGADLRHPRRQGHGDAIALRLAADPHRGRQRGHPEDRVRGPVGTRSPGLSWGRTELLAIGKSTGRSTINSKARSSIRNSSPSWASRGTVQSQGGGDSVLPCSASPSPT